MKDSKLEKLIINAASPNQKPELQKSLESLIEKITLRQALSILDKAIREGCEDGALKLVESKCKTFENCQIALSRIPVTFPRVTHIWNLISSIANTAKKGKQKEWVRQNRPSN